jgi:hypothetical protein
MEDAIKGGTRVGKIREKQYGWEWEGFILVQMLKSIVVIFKL